MLAEKPTPTGGRRSHVLPRQLCAGSRSVGWLWGKLWVMAEVYVDNMPQGLARGGLTVRKHSQQGDDDTEYATCRRWPALYRLRGRLAPALMLSACEVVLKGAVEKGCLEAIAEYYRFQFPPL